MNRIDYLIVSSSFDYSTDLVCYRLHERKQNYYRLNRDELKSHRISLDLQKKRMYIEFNELAYYADFENLKAIYFRAPVFLRTQSKKILSVEEQLERNQWSAFIRNLSVFENAKWINSPKETYYAENKLMQLYLAKKCGISVPETIVSNSVKQSNIPNGKCKYIVKSLDTALFYDFDSNQELFTYSCVVDMEELNKIDISQAPIIIQKCIEPKIDCRITYVDGRIFPVRILLNGEGIHGDWRKEKNGLTYEKFTLPPDICSQIHQLMQRLNLCFGGIDLIESNNKYYFVEVNPTGEWGWLETGSGLRISEEIANALMR